jgi:hypothetical protein
MEAAATSTLLMLDQPRVISVREGKRLYTFEFRRITQQDWERYFNGLYVASRNDGQGQTNTMDLQTAGIELFESTVSKVTGYRRELNTPEDFKKVFPRHAINVSWILRSVFASTEEDDSPLDCDTVESRIDAVWSQTKAGDETTMFKGLVHRFLPPSIEQKKKYLRTGSVSKIIGGSRRGGTTIYTLRNKVMLDLYDELIQSVEGYGVNGAPLTGAEAIKREMDAYHKVEAVSQIFNVQQEAAAESAA